MARSLDDSVFSRALRTATTVRFSKLLPSPVQSLVFPNNDSKPKHRPKSTAWLDGIRGCAALVVFFEHLSLSVQDSHSMVRAYGSPGAYSLWQLPVIRLLYDGTPMVPIFYVTSGCALSLKPLSHIRRGEQESLCSTISSATFRRAFRLFLPSVAISFITMLFTQIGIYNHPYSFIVGNAMEIDRPQRLPNIAAQYVDWLNWATTRLLYSEEMFRPQNGSTVSNYGFQLWTISTEFYCSILLFITLVGLARMEVLGRQILLLCLCAFALYSDRWDVACFLAGISVTELFIQPKASVNHVQGTLTLPTHICDRSSLVWLHTCRQFMFGLLFLIGLFIASYPGKQASENFIYQPLSAFVNKVRFWESVGAVFILISISQLESMRSVFASAVPRYLGRISFGVYLTHVTFLNVFGWRVVPWIWLITGDEQWWTRQGGFVLGLIACLIVLIWVADLWTRAVDEPCVRLAKKVDTWATAK